MDQLSCDLGLATESSYFYLIGKFAGPNDFERNNSIEVFVSSAIDNSHPSSVDFVEDFISVPVGQKSRRLGAFRATHLAMQFPAFGDLVGPTGILGDQPLELGRRMLVDLDLQNLGENLIEFHDLDGFRP